VVRGAHHDKQKSLLVWRFPIIEDRTEKRYTVWRKAPITYCASAYIIESRLQGKNQVVRGAHHDKQKSLLVWRFPIIEDRTENRYTVWRKQQLLTA
jgi:hypothetical protein